MSYEDKNENIENSRQHQPAIYPSKANFSTHEIQPRLRLGQPSKDLLHLVKVTQITPFPFDLDVLNASLGRGVLDTLDGLVSLVFLSVDHDHSTVSKGEGEGDFFTDSFGSSGDDGGLRADTTEKGTSVKLRESEIKEAMLLTLPDKSPSSGLAGPMMGSSTACIVVVVCLYSCGVT